MGTCTIIIAPSHLEIGPAVPGGGLLGLIFHEFGSSESLPHYSLAILWPSIGLNSVTGMDLF